MKPENKRIFISDLPETCTKEELENRFSKYGQVSSVEIKERKELGQNNKSLFFSYINLITDDKDLNQCFRELSKTKWHGERVQLQLARESFLERLKRERQEAEGERKNDNNLVQKETTVVSNRTFIEKASTPTSNGLRIQISRKYKSSSESESDTSESGASDVNIEEKSKIEEDSIVIKSNKNKLAGANKGGLKIPSFGKAPIAEISLTKNKITPNDSASNLKRLQSLRDMKKGYATQKSLIKNALVYGANKPNNKIVFDDSIDTGNKASKKNKAALFQEGGSEDDSDFEANFNVKEQFQGKSGQRLLELQSRYKNDKRFNLDERFIEPAEMDVAENNLDEEKDQQLKILEEVLGKKLTSKSSYNNKTDSSTTRKTMVKFDPSQPEHSSLELAVAQPEIKKRKKGKSTKDPESEEPQKQQPEVSKEIFYKVPEKLKETFSEKPQFSLLSMFGRTDDKQENNVADNIEQDTGTGKELTKNHRLGNEKNPFKYDSSDEGEDETDDIPHKATTPSGMKKSESTPTRNSQSSGFWTEPFFFKSDDFRLQEGLDFIEKIKGEDKEFLKIRRDLKGIVKAKVRNNERKNKMFKRKLGGSKQRKHIRIKKALKR